MSLVTSLLLPQLLLLLIFSTANAAGPTSFGACQAPNQESGLCVHIQDCNYLFNILNATVTTPTQRQLLSDSQCGLDNTRRGNLVQRILVCCPDSQCKNRNGAQFEGAELGNVLPGMGTCGTIFANRIYGGKKTQLAEFPWMALLIYKKPMNNFGHHCGGALINTRYVLTASHCIANPKLPSTWLLHSVRLGEWNTSQVPDCVDQVNGNRTCAPLHIDVEIERRFVHELYVPASIDQMHDIALLRLKEKVVYTEFVKPICLPIGDEMRNQRFVDYAMEVAGWGTTENDRPSDVKLKITVDVWTIARCQDKYRTYQNHVNDSQLCAGGRENVDTCSGDSGGPLMVANHVGDQEIFFAVGVTSYGPTPCGLAGWPGVYTRVGAYIDWIQHKLEQ